jgi:5'-nucleotidase
MMMKKRLKILLTNDDGYSFDGLKHLYEALIRRHDVIIAAPQEQQSGIGHAFTFNKPLQFMPIPDVCGLPGFAIKGTPSDCVKFALGYLLPQKPDVVISGMNDGENSGISGFYSGTVAAAREGAFWGLPSFAFSLNGGEKGYFPEYAKAALDIVELVMSNMPASTSIGIGDGQVFYNVNFPSCAPDKCKGRKVTRQSLAFFEDRYRRIQTGQEQDGFMIYGEKTNVEESELFDSRALLNDYTTITPLCLDATAHWLLKNLSVIEQSR